LSQASVVARGTVDRPLLSRGKTLLIAINGTQVSSVASLNKMTDNILTVYIAWLQPKPSLNPN